MATPPGVYVLLGGDFTGAGAYDHSCVVSSATIHHGRDDPASQPDASTATIELIGALPAGVDIGTVVRVLADLGASQSRSRFAGKVTDVAVHWDDVDQPMATLICAGQVADMGRAVIGDTPWPAELDGARAARAISLAGVYTDPTLQDPGTVTVLARDVDAQPALVVAGDAAEDGAGMLWQDRSGRVAYADALHRRNAPIALELDACHVPLDATWSKAIEGLANDLRIRYGIVPTDGTDQAELHVTQASSISTYGRYDASITTRLQDQAAAQQRADLILARQAVPAWVLSGLGLPLELLPAEDWSLVVALLTLDVGSLLSVTGLPAGSPYTSALVWVEGWTETIEAAVGGGPGHWQIDLATSDYCATAAVPRWDDVDAAITWDTYGSATWDGASCLPPTPSRGRWDDTASSLRWDTVDDTITWDTWAG